MGSAIAWEAKGMDRMTSTQTRAIILLLAAILLALIGLQIRERPPPLAASPSASLDRREPVRLNPEQLDHSLGQMRGLLAALNDYERAASEGDFGSLAALAAKQGPGAGRNAPRGLHEAQPESFRALSGTMRQSFAAMEKAAQAGDIAGVRAARQSVGNACVACHESYRFELAPAK